MKGKILAMVVFCMFFLHSKSNSKKDQPDIQKKEFVNSEGDITNEKLSKIKSYTIHYKSLFDTRYPKIWSKCKIDITFNYNLVENQIYFRNKWTDEEMILAPIEVEKIENDPRGLTAIIGSVNEKTEEIVNIGIGTNYVFILYFDKSGKELKTIKLSEEKLYETWLDRTSDLADKINQQ